ncbi:MAG: hypothetical protein SGILL_007896, partial [Bacillariaceae sp.]
HFIMSSSSSSNKKNMDNARRFLFEDDEAPASQKRNSGQQQQQQQQKAQRGFSTRDFAVDQSVNLMDMGGSGSGSGRSGSSVGVASGGAHDPDRRGSSSTTTSSGRLSGTISGLFRGSGGGGDKTNLSGGTVGRFEEYGDAAPSAEAEEYISDKRRRLGPVATTLGKMGLHGTKLVICLMVGFALLGGGLLMAISSTNGSASSSTSDSDTSSAANASGEVINTDAVRYDNIKKRISDAKVTPNDVLESGSGSPQKLALDWIAQQDPAQLKFDHPALLDRYSLAVFYLMSRNAPNGGWTNSDGWLTGTGHCAWYGIECVPREQEATEENEFNPLTSTYDDNDRITGILLNANGIEGEIPDEWGIALNTLITVSMEDNEITHTLPTTFGQLANLRSLLLSNNKLNSELPDAYGALSNIHQINLAHNDFEGPIPASWSNMKELRNFAVSNNLLTGDFSSFARMTKLIGLELSDNDFQGTIPSFIENFKDLSKYIHERGEHESDSTMQLSLTHLQIFLFIHPCHSGLEAEPQPIQWRSIAPELVVEY